MRQFLQRLDMMDMILPLEVVKVDISIIYIMRTMSAITERIWCR